MIRVHFLIFFYFYFVHLFFLFLAVGKVIKNKCFFPIKTHDCHFAIRHSANPHSLTQAHAHTQLELRVPHHKLSRAWLARPRHAHRRPLELLTGPIPRRASYRLGSMRIPLKVSYIIFNCSFTFFLSSFYLFSVEVNKVCLIIYRKYVLCFCVFAIFIVLV